MNLGGNTIFRPLLDGRFLLQFLSKNIKGGIFHEIQKTIIASVAVLALTGFITGCGDEKKAAAPAPKDSRAVTLKVGVSPVPHAEILGAVKDKLAKEGINVEIIEFTDYVQPNLALNDKTLMRTTSSTNRTWMNSSGQEI